MNNFFFFGLIVADVVGGVTDCVPGFDSFKFSSLEFIRTRNSQFHSAQMKTEPRIVLLFNSPGIEIKKKCSL